MTIEFRCTECQKELSTPDDGAGKQARCTGCGALVAIPDPTVNLWPPGLGPKPKPQPPATPPPRRNGPPPLPDMPWVPGAPKAAKAPQALPAMPVAEAAPVAAPVASLDIPTAAPVAGPVEMAPVELDPLASTEDEVDRAFLSYERAIDSQPVDKPAVPKPTRVPIVLPDDEPQHGGANQDDKSVLRRAWKAVRGERGDEDD